MFFVSGIRFGGVRVQSVSFVSGIVFGAVSCRVCVLFVVYCVGE